MENPNEILVYDKYKLGKVEGKFDRSMRKLELGTIPMTRSVAEDYNAVTDQIGIFLVLDEEATQKYKEYEKNRNAERIAKVDKKKSDAKELINSVFETLLKEKQESGSSTDPTLKEMKTLCEEKKYPKSEWQTLRKEEMVSYLKSKEE